MTLAGGYILHINATHEGEAPALMTGMDSLSQIVLANVKLPSEHADDIVPFLQRLQSDYGNPRACGGRRSQVFDRLRKAMRIATPNRGNGLNDFGRAARLMATVI